MIQSGFERGKICHAIVEDTKDQRVLDVFRKNPIYLIKVITTSRNTYKIQIGTAKEVQPTLAKYRAYSLNLTQTFNNRISQKDLVQKLKKIEKHLYTTREFFCKRNDL